MTPRILTHTIFSALLVAASIVMADITPSRNMSVALLVGAVLLAATFFWWLRRQTQPSQD